MIRAGGTIVEVLASTSNGPPTRGNLDAWVSTFRLPVTVVMDPPGSGTVSLRTLGVRESTFIVDTRTMEIVEKYNGSVAGIGASGVAQAIPRMLELLAQP